MNVTYIVSIISVAFCLFFFFYVKWYIKKRTSASELLAEYRTEVYRLIAEIDSVTDRDSRLVEDRIKKLNAILDDTDKRLSVYMRELERSRSGEALYTSLGRGIRAALKTPLEATPSAQSVTAPLAPSAPTAPSAPKLSVVRTQAQQLPLEPPPSELSLQSAQPEPVRTVQKAPSKKQIRSEIEMLVNQGVSAGEIASVLDISLSEVDLAINLLSRQKKPGSSH